MSGPTFSAILIAPTSLDFSSALCTGISAEVLALVVVDHPARDGDLALLAIDHVVRLHRLRSSAAEYATSLNIDPGSYTSLTAWSRSNAGVVCRKYSD